MKVSRRTFLAAAAGATPAVRSFAGFGKYLFGVAGPASDFDNSVRYGFDYHEAHVWEVANMPEGESERFKNHVLGSPLRCRRFNLFSASWGDSDSPAIRVVGPNAGTSAARAYVERALPRCRQLGAEIVVWGSAASRNVPEGFSRARAWAQIQDFLRMVNPIARSQKIAIAVEPLRAAESNILNTGAEVKMVRELNLPNINGSSADSQITSAERYNRPNSTVRTADLRIGGPRYARFKGLPYPSGQEKIGGNSSKAVTDAERVWFGLLGQVSVPQVRLCQGAESPVGLNMVPIQLHTPSRREVEGRGNGVRNMRKNWFCRFQHHASSILYTVNNRSKFNFFACS